MRQSQITECKHCHLSIEPVCESEQWIHIEGPQKMLHTCAVYPYGYEAGPIGEQCGENCRCVWDSSVATVQPTMDINAVPIDVGPETWWWLSFVDPSRSAPRHLQVPGGGGFLGVSCVQGRDIVDACVNARRSGCNPGGEVQGYLLSCVPPVEYRYRLLTQVDVDAWDAEEEEEMFTDGS